MHILICNISPQDPKQSSQNCKNGYVVTPRAFSSTTWHKCICYTCLRMFLPIETRVMSLLRPFNAQPRFHVDHFRACALRLDPYRNATWVVVFVPSFMLLSLKWTIQPFLDDNSLTIIQTVKTDSEHQCSSECLDEAKCASVNYKAKGNDAGLCELNTKTLEQLPEEGQKNAEYVYIGFLQRVIKFVNELLSYLTAVLQISLT